MAIDFDSAEAVATPKVEDIDFSSAEPHVPVVQNQHVGMEHKTSSGQEGKPKNASDLGFIKQEAKAGFGDIPALVNEAAKTSAKIQHSLVGAVKFLSPDAKKYVDGLIVEPASTEDVRKPFTTDNEYVPETRLGKIGGIIVRQVGSNIIPGVGLDKSALEAAIKLGVKPAAKAIVKNLGTTAKISAGAGLGQFAGEQATDSPFGSSVGSLAGGIWGGGSLPAAYHLAKKGIIAVASSHPIENVKELVKNTKSVLTDKVQPAIQAKVKGSIAEAVLNYNEGEGLKNLEEATALQQKIKDLRLSAAQSTGVPVIVGNEIRSVKSSIDAYTARRIAENNNAAAILAHMKSPGSDTAEGLQAGITKLHAEFQAKGNQLQNEADKLADQLVGLKGKVNVNLTPEQRGLALTEQRKLEKASADSIAAAKYAKARELALATNAKFDTSVINTVAEQELAKPINAYDPNNTPTVIRMIQAKHAPKEGDAPGIVDMHGKPFPKGPVISSGDYDELSAMKSAVSSDIRSEISSTNPNKRSRLRSLLNIQKSIDEAITGSAHKDVAALYASASEHYKSVYAPRFLKGMNMKMTSTDNYGNQRVLNENILRDYTKNVASTRQFIDLFGKNPEAIAAMEDHLMEKYAKSGMQNGEINLDKHNKFLADNKHVLETLKAAGINTLDEFRNIGKLAQNISDRKIENVIMQKGHAEDNLKHILGIGSVEEVTKEAMKTPQAMTALTQRLDREGSKSLMDYVIRDAAKAFEHTDVNRIGLNTAKVGKYLDENSRQLNILFKSALGEKEGAEHFARLKDSYRALQMMDRARIGEHFTAADVSADPFQNALGFSFRSFFNLGRSYITGRDSIPDIAIALGGQSATYHYIKAFNEIQQQIMTDPESSKNLAKMVAESAKLKPNAKVMSDAWSKIAGNAGVANEGAGKFVAKFVAKLADYYKNNGKLSAIGAAASTTHQERPQAQDEQIDIPEGLF